MIVKINFNSLLSTFTLSDCMVDKYLVLCLCVCVFCPISFENSSSGHLVPGSLNYVKTSSKYPNT